MAVEALHLLIDGWVPNGFFNKYFLIKFLFSVIKILTFIDLYL